MRDLLESNGRDVRASEAAAYARGCGAHAAATLEHAPGQNLIYVHLNRVTEKYDIDALYESGPRNGGLAVVSNTSKAPAVRSIPASVRTRPGCGSSLFTFHVRKEFHDANGPK